MALITAITCTNFSHDKKDGIHAGQMFVRASSFATGNGWGYKIYTNDSLYIRQPFIPGIAGKYTFSSAEDAMKIARVVMQKMEIQHRMPCITKEDLIQQHIQLP